MGFSVFAFYFLKRLSIRNGCLTFFDVFFAQIAVLEGETGRTSFELYAILGVVFVLLFVVVVAGGGGGSFGWDLVGSWLRLDSLCVFFPDSLLVLRFECARMG